MGRSKILRSASLTALILFSYLVPSRAALDYGLVFKSYEVSPEERTSLSLSSGYSGAHSPLQFTDSLRINFTLKFNLNVGKFGYICSIIPAKAQQMDILLYTPSHEEPAIHATGDHLHMTSIPIMKDRWHDLSVLVKHEGDSVVMSLNGLEISRIYAPHGHVQANVNFGKNNLENHESDDVAPMVIKDLSVKIDRNEPVSWKLTGDENELNKKISLNIGNPLWLKQLNSSWSQMRSIQVPSVSYICPDEKNGMIYIISDKMVSRYDVASMTLSQWQTSNNIRADLTTNDYIILEDGTLAYLDIDSMSIIRFDMNTHDWECSNTRTKRSVYLHNNILRDSRNGHYLHMFGYGQHRYNKIIREWNPQDGSLKIYDIDGVTPRYMSAAAIRDGKIYVYSGKGNIQGAQEFGTQIYNDFIEIDLDSQSAKTLWTKSAQDDEVAASNIIPESNKNSFLALTYNPKAYNTALQLKRIDMEGNETILAQPLPFNFLDIESEAKLFYCEKTDAYYAIISQKNNEGGFTVSVHNILRPITEYSAKAEENNDNNAAVIILLTVLAAGFTSILYIRKKRENRKKTFETISKDAIRIVEKSLPGIYLLGGFKVINRAGQDISGSFSPLMKQLLSIIVLNSGSAKGGISNTRLKEALWYDKSDNSYNNNRGVTLTKIRTMLQEVDKDLAIVSNNGHWYIEDPNGMCDYIKAHDAISRKASLLEEVLSVASMGNLLPEMRTEWMDHYKSEYENLIISRLRKGLEKIKESGAELVMIQIADAILIFDPLDEDSVRLKCQCLIALKRAGAAKRVFDQFCSNYRTTLGEDFSENFTYFTKNSAY